MGRCFAYSYGPKILKEKLRDARYFVYSPDYDSAGYSSDQFFSAVVEASDARTIEAEIAAKLGLTPVPQKPGRYFLGDHSLISFYQRESSSQLNITVSLKDEYGAVSEKLIDAVLEIDRHLQEEKLDASPLTRYQDVVFGEKHIHASELSKPFKQPGVVYVPPQSEWIVGATFEEALALWQKRQRK